MNANQKAEKELLVCPGDSILETIQHLKLSQAEFSKRLGLTPEKVNDIIKGKEPITVKTAFLLERVLKIDAQFWLNLEKIYRESLYRIDQYQYLDSCLDWLKKIPVAFLKKNQYIPNVKGRELVQSVFQFFRVASPKEWEEIYVLKFANTDYKKSTNANSTLGSMATWLRLGEIEMEKVNLKKYDKQKFLEVLEEARQLLVCSNDKKFPEHLKALCKNAGVELTYTPKITNAPVSGATRWINGNPLVQLTDRHMTNDHFWFAFFHEAGHIIKHGKTEIFIENFEGFKYDLAKEKEANTFSQKMLLDNNAIIDLGGNYSESNIKKIALRYNTHPSIVLGRLQHDQIISYSHLRHLKINVELFS